MDIICHPVACDCWLYLQATWLGNCYLLRNLAMIKNDLPGREAVLLILFMRLSSKLDVCMWWQILHDTASLVNQYWFCLPARR